MDDAVHRVFHRRGIDLARRHVGLAVRVDPHAALGREADVYALAHIAYVFAAVQQVHYLLLIAAHREPAFHRVVVVQTAGIIHKVLILFERHAGFLRPGIGGKEAEIAFQRPRGRAPEVLLLHGFQGFSAQCSVIGIQAVVFAQVEGGLDEQVGFVLAHGLPVCRRNVLLRKSRSFVDEDAVFLSEIHVHIHRGASLQSRAIHLADERFGQHGAVHIQSVAGLYFHAIMHEQLGVFGQDIFHSSLFFNFLHFKLNNFHWLLATSYKPLALFSQSRKFIFKSR